MYSYEDRIRAVIGKSGVNDGVHHVPGAGLPPRSVRATPGCLNYL